MLKSKIIKIGHNGTTTHILERRQPSMVQDTPPTSTLQEHIDKTKKHTRMKTQIGMDFNIGTNVFPPPSLPQV
jgi:hypothetical protein